MIRALVGILYESLKGYRQPKHIEASIPLTISVESELSYAQRERTREIAKENLSLIKGETKYLSENQIAFIVPSIRIGQNYLAGAESKPLNVVLDLPAGKISLQAVGESYEQIGKDIAVAKYLIAAQISKMPETDRRIYGEYLREGYKTHKNAGKNLAIGVTHN
jgi:hypothetical protein